MKKLKIAIIFLMLTNVTACANAENESTNIETNIETTIEKKTEVENITDETTYESLSDESEIIEETETQEIKEYVSSEDILQISVDEEGLLSLEMDESDYIDLRNSLNQYNANRSKQLKSLETQDMGDAFSKVSIHRADKYSLSFLSKNYMEDPVNGPKYLSFDTYNYEASTGKLLELEDVISHKDNIDEIIKEQINKYYSDKTLDEHYFNKVISENGYEWVISYQGVTFYFPADIFGETEFEPIPVTVLFNEKSDIFSEKCTEVPHAYVMDMDSKSQYLIDTDEDGDCEKVNTVYYVDDTENITELEITIDDKTITCNSSIGLYDRYCRTYFVHTESDKNFMIAYMDTSIDNTGEYIPIDISIDYTEPVKSDFIYLADYRITDPNNILFYDFCSLLNGIWDFYTISDCKIDEFGNIINVKGDDFYASSDLCVKTLKEITANEISKEDSHIIKKDVRLPIGTILEPYRTDDETYIDFVDSDGKLYHIDFEIDYDTDYGSIGTIKGTSVVEYMIVSVLESEDIKLINYGIEDKADYEKIVQQSINLDEDTYVDIVEWVDAEEGLLRVSVCNQESQNDLGILHKGDYFYYKNNDKIEYFYVSYSYDSEERMIWIDPTFECILDDVNFDGTKDLLINLGKNGMSELDMFCLYIKNENGYEYCPSFEQICSYSLDADNKYVISNMQDGYVDYYQYKDGEFVKVQKRL